MLLPREQSPWNCGYFLGAVALGALSHSPNGKADLLELQRLMSKTLSRPISPTQVVTAASWLFKRWLRLVGQCRPFLKWHLASC